MVTPRVGWVALLLALAWLAAATSRPAAQMPRAIAVAAASDLQTVLPELAARFEREAGSKVTVSLGSSGNFFAQIQNGAPFDVFLSADVVYPRTLVDSGHAERDSLYTYAAGRIVLWARTDRGIDVGRGLAALTDPKVTRVAIANPRHAPYGRAAEAALRHQRLYDAVRPKLVLGENIAQAAQLVESGNADAGILALSLALGARLAERGAFSEIPAAWHPPLEQAAVVLTASRNAAGARRFLEVLKRPDGLDLLRKFGFTRPGP